jgi:hypothetical protein
MKRREFTAGLAAPARLAPSPSSAQTPIWHPLLLIAPADPFTGLTLLKSRYASGPRPSEDMEGWALSWRLTGQDTFAERALAEMRTKPFLPAKVLRGRGSISLGGRWGSIGLLDTAALRAPCRIVLHTN